MDISDLFILKKLNLIPIFTISYKNRSHKSAKYHMLAKHDISS